MASEWKYESRSQRRRRMISELQRAASAVQPYVESGDYGGARQALSEASDDMPDVRAYRAQQPPQQPAPAEQVAPQEEPAPKKKAGGFMGALDRITPEFLEPVAKKSLTALDAPRKYVGGPLWSVGTGLTGTESRVDPETGLRYRGKPSYGDWGRGLVEAVTRNPLDTYREGRAATDERLNDPNLSKADRVLLMALSDPLTYIPGGAVRSLARALPASVRASKAGMVAGPVARTFEAPGSVMAGATVGGALATDAADRMGFDGGGAQFLAAGIGGIAGAGAASRATRRGIGARGPVAAVVPDAPATGSVGQGLEGGFVTGQGSRYVLHSDGTTTRFKAPRAAHPGESGLQPRSTHTWFVEDIAALRPAQAIYGAGIRVTVAEIPGMPGRIGVKYVTGPDAGKFQRDTVTAWSSVPSLGSSPIESWGDGFSIHFGNRITQADDLIKLPASDTPSAIGQAIAQGATVDSGAEAKRVMAAGIGGGQGLEGGPSVGMGQVAGGIFRLPVLQRTPLTRTDRIVNVLKRTIHSEPVERDELAYPVMKWRQEVKPIIDSQAARTGILVEDVARDAFPRDATGRIQTIPGAPTVSHLAARLPEFMPFLSSKQVTAIELIREELAGFRQLLDDAGVQISGRADIMEGGFYIPRGSAELPGMDLPRAVNAGRVRAGGKAPWQKHAKIETQVKGIEEGYEYSTLQEAIEAYAHSSGRVASDKHVTDYFASLRDEDGNLLASTAKDRMDPVIRARYQDAVGQLLKLRDRVRTAEKRAGLAGKQADEADRVMDEFERGMPDAGTSGVARTGTELRNQRERGENWQARAEAEAGEKPRRMMTGGGPVRIETPATAAEMAAAKISDARAEEILRVVDRLDRLVPEDVDRLRFLDTAMRRTTKRIAALRARGGKYATVADNLEQQMAWAKQDIDVWRPAYKMAQDNARATPKGYAVTGFDSLSGNAFPVRFANVVNDMLKKEMPPTGKFADNAKVIAALNGLSRGFRASMDASFLGIQGAIGMARDPLGYAKALTVAFKALADETVLGEYFRHFDEKALTRGRPTSREWAANGLHLGGTQTEFTIGEGLGKYGYGLQTKGKLNPIRGSNRMFGNFGDALRLELADNAYGSSKFAGYDMAVPAHLESVANVANRATGWSPSRFAGDAGELALFAPRFFQSQFEFLGMAAAGRGPGAVEARRMLAQFVGLGVGVTVMANVAQEGGIPLEEVFDPTSYNFMRFRVNGVDVSIFGPWDSLVRGIVTTAKDGGDPRDFYRSKSSPVVAAAWNALSGTDFRGADISKGQILAELVTPFSLSDSVLVGGDKGLGQTAVGLTGTKATAMTPNEQLDQLSRAKYGKGFYELSPADKKAMKDAHPDIWESAVSRKDQAGQRWEAVKIEYIEAQARRDTRLFDGGMTLQQWRDARGKEMSEKAGQFQGIYADKNFEGRSDKMLQGYFDALDQADVDGVFDYEIVDSYLASLDDAGREHIAKNVGVDASPVEKLYKRLAKEYYAIPQYQRYDADVGREINALAAEVGNRVKGDNEAQRLRALRQLEATGEWSPDAIQGVRRSVLGLLREARGRAQYVRAHPEISLLTGRGSLTPEMTEAIRKAAA